MKKLAITGLALFFTACTPIGQQSFKTQLEVREFQTRTYDTGKTDEVLSAVVEAFQDQGFMVKNVVPQVGLVSASREIDMEDSGQAALRTFLLGQNAVWEKNTIIEATANVKTQGRRTKVRATFQEKVMNNKGNIEKVHTLDDPKFYQDFFDKIGKSIFIERQKI